MVVCVWTYGRCAGTCIANRVRRQSGFPTFIPCQRQDVNVLPKRRQSHQGDKLCDVSTVPLGARWPVFLARGCDADGEPHLEWSGIWVFILYLQCFLVAWFLVCEITIYLMLSCLRSKRLLLPFAVFSFKSKLSTAIYSGDWLCKWRGPFLSSCLAVHGFVAHFRGSWYI